MGYWTQKKKYNRRRITIGILLIILTFFSLSSFIFDGLNEWRFQFYLLSFITMIYAAFNRFFIYSFIAAILLLINFFVISSCTSIFLTSKDYKQEKERIISLIFQNETKDFLEIFEQTVNHKAKLLAVVNPKNNDINPSGLIPTNYFLSAGEQGGSFIVSKSMPISAGKLILSKDNSIIFARLKIEEKDYIFLSLDLSKLNKKQQKAALKHISSFILSEDDPIIIFGNFGMTAWNSLFIKFLTESGLKVKNNLLSLLPNLFLPPTNYVIGYKNMEFIDLKRLPKKENSYAPMLFELKV